MGITQVHPGHQENSSAALQMKEGRLIRVKHIFFLFLVITLALSFGGCKKKQPPVPDVPADTGAGTPTDTGEAQPPTERQTEGEAGADIFEECTKQLQPVFYDYNKSDVRDDQITALQNNARVLKSPQCGVVTVLIEGHCDERGTDEYNLALGERRANSAKDYLVSLGIPDNRLNTLSYGESRPFAQGQNEEAWAMNRRAHFVAVRK